MKPAGRARSPATRGGAPAIYLMRADGSNQTKISEGNGLLPDWGPQVQTEAAK